MRGVFCLAVACLAVAGPLAAESGPGKPVLLKRDKPIEAELLGGQTNSYKVHAKAGQFVRVVTLQEGIDVSVTALGPSGKQILTADSLNGSFGPEPVSFVAGESGDFRLNVSASPGTPPGRYQVQLTDLRRPTDADQKRISAERAYMEGVTLYSLKSRESAAAAVASWMESLALWQSLDDKYGQALSLLNAVSAESDLGGNQKALDYLAQALPLAGAVGEAKIKANLLMSIGETFDSLGEIRKALDSYTQALPLQRATGDRVGEGNTLSLIGEAYSDLGGKRKALEYLDQALPILQSVRDQLGEANTLNYMGAAYMALGEKQEALDAFNQALALRRTLGDRAGEATALANIGVLYTGMGEPQKALDYYNQALPIRRALGNPESLANTLANIGAVYEQLGEWQKALDNYFQALPLCRQVGEREGEAITLSNIGAVYDDMKQRQKALDYYFQALALLRATGDRRGEAGTLGNIGLVYGLLGDRQKALDYDTQALAMRREIGDRGGMAVTLDNMGTLYAALGEKQKALDSFTEALPLFRAVHDPLGEGHVLADLMEFWQNQQNPRLAVLFGKQAIDRFQQVRRNIAGLQKEDKQSFLKTKDYYYRKLAGLLVAEGRLPEAQQVIDLLKAEEYEDFTQHRGAADSATGSVVRTPMEERAKQEYDQITTDITTIGEQWSQLHAKASRTPEEEKQYANLSDMLTAANQRLQTYLNTLYDSFGKGDQANARMEAVNDQSGSLETLVGDLGEGTTAVYTILLDDKCVLMVITPSTRVAREVAITKVALRAKVFDFVSALAEKHSIPDIQAKGQDLYSVLIAPIAKDLQGAHAATIVWSLDDALRYIPLAALYDGKQYLVERYRNVVITTASAGNLKDQPQVSSWRGVAMGVSKDYDGLGQLKAVPGELDAVIHSEATAGSNGPVAGTILLDDSFTETNMETALERHPSLVHIASHYVFKAGDDKNSYLLLGGKSTGGQGFRLTLADMRDDQRMDFKGIELLTLSGCQTALGSNDSDGREIDGLGITAQRKGAKAVVATLWPVDDASVGLLMATFYKLWVTTPGMTKAEALQQAQLVALRGSMGSKGTGSTARGSALVLPASAPADHAGPPYANPFYWAPFILIGNWK